jgi:hypothetical protein
MVSGVTVVNTEDGDYAKSCGSSEVSEFLQVGPPW